MAMQKQMGLLRSGNLLMYVVSAFFLSFVLVNFLFSKMGTLKCVINYLRD